MGSRVWNAVLLVKFKHEEKDKDRDSPEQILIRKLQKLKSKKMLSKNKLKELEELENKYKTTVKSKGPLDGKKVQAQIKAELRESEALISEKKTAKIAQQIFTKVLAIAFNVLRNFPQTEAFEAAVECIVVNVSRSSRQFLKDSLEELRRAFDTLCALSKKTDEIRQRKLQIILAFVRLGKVRGSLTRGRRRNR